MTFLSRKICATMYNFRRSSCQYCSRYLLLNQVAIGAAITSAVLSPVKIYLMKVTNKYTRKRFEIYSKLTIKIREDNVVLTLYS